MIPGHEVAERALALSQSPECVVIVEDTSHVDLRWARSTLTTNGEHDSVSVTVIAIDGARAVSRSISHPTPERLRDLVAQADGAVGGATPQTDVSPLVRGDDEAPDWSEPAQRTSSAELMDLAVQLGAAFEDRALEHFGYAEHERTTTWLGTSTGLRLRHLQPQGRLEMTAKSHGRSRSAWWGASSELLGTVDVSAGVSELRRGLDWQARSAPVQPGRHPAVLTPSAVGDLMVDLWWSAVGKDAAEGRSVFSGPNGTRLGERIAGAGVDLVSDPADQVIPSAPFECVSSSSAYASVYDNGLPLQRTRWIADGVLEALIGSRRAAADTGLPLVPAPSTLRLEAGGTGHLDGLIESTDYGLLVTCLWYNRLVDPQTLLLTGLTRDGVYVIRDGEVVGAAGNFRFNDSPVGLLGHISGATAPVRTLPREFGDYAPRVVMPAVRLESFNFSTRSDAL